MAFETETQEAIVHGLNGATYGTSGFGIALTFFDNHAAALMAVIAIVTFITSTVLNFYWKKKHYLLEVEKLRRRRMDADENGTE